MVRWR